jgi:hypothetical protein
MSNSCRIHQGNFSLLSQRDTLSEMETHRRGCTLHYEL